MAIGARFAIMWHGQHMKYAFYFSLGDRTRAWIQCAHMVMNAEGVVIEFKAATVKAFVALWTVIRGENLQVTAPLQHACLEKLGVNLTGEGGEDGEVEFDSVAFGREIARGPDLTAEQRKNMRKLSISFDPHNGNRAIVRLRVWCSDKPTPPGFEAGDPNECYRIGQRVGVWHKSGGGD